jgi:hypothetical protein
VEFEAKGQRQAVASDEAVGAWLGRACRAAARAHPAGGRRGRPRRGLPGGCGKPNERRAYRIFPVR